jgi:hypothetical protein
MRTAKKIRYRLEWLALKFATKVVPLLSRKACYRLALLLGSLGATFVSVFVGMQQLLTQVPPNRLRSIIATFIPVAASRTARDGPA